MILSAEHCHHDRRLYGDYLKGTIKTSKCTKIASGTNRSMEIFRNIQHINRDDVSCFISPRSFQGEVLSLCGFFDFEEVSKLSHVVCAEQCKALQ